MGISLGPALLEGVRSACLGRPSPPFTSVCTAAYRVDGKELPPKNWREPKPEYGDFHPVSSDPKNPWPACGPRNGLVGPLQGCGKPPGKVGPWERGWVLGPESSLSLGPGSCWVCPWSLRAGGLQTRRPILQGS